MEKQKSVKTVRKFEEAMEFIRKRQYHYHWRPQYLEDLGDGPRAPCSMGVTQSEGADFIMKGYSVTMNKKKCTKCGTCWVVCSLGVIREVEDGYFEIDHDYCRPCGICAQECPAGAIEFRAGE